MLLFDVSASTSTEQRSRYAEYGKSLWDHVAKESSTVEKPAALQAALITGSGLAEEQILFDEDAPKYSFFSTDGRDRIRARTQAAEKKVKAGLEKLLTSMRSNTAVLDGLDLADRFFSAHPGASKTLYIFSDMLEQSDRLNMGDSRLRLGKAEIASFIDKERSNQLLPNLRGVRIIVCGARAQDAAKYRMARAFWLEYAKAAGAQLEAKDYGVLFRLP
ncbi:MAG: hypothetical protein Q7R48_03840 [bacterium]|nr:hypothetical protein [bacterium]